MILTTENYFSKEMSLKYCGSSQLKSAIECEARTLDEIDGLWEEEGKDAFLEGNYLDAHFDKTLDEFKASHPELFSQTGAKGLLAKYSHIEKVINTIENDSILLNLLTGKRQQIFTGSIAGMEFKIMVDSLHPDKIVDGKFMRDFTDKWSDGEGMKVEWWRVYRYDIQAAIYTEVMRQNGYELPFHLAAVSKEKVTDKSWLVFSDQTLRLALEEVISIIEGRWKAVKSRLIPPTSCGKCARCISKKKLTDPIEV